MDGGENLPDGEFEFHRWDISPKLGALGREIVAINEKNGWAVMTPEGWDVPFKVPCVLALITSEISEALEAYREGNKGHFAEEMADTLIRLLDLTHGLRIDIGMEVLKKLEVNRNRGYKHGGKVC